MKFRQKVMLLPALAGLGFALVLVLTYHLGTRSEQVLAHIESGHAALLELSRDLEELLQEYRYTLQDASGEAERLAEADALERRFRARLASAGPLPGLDEAQRAGLEQLFTHYATLARATSAQALPRRAGPAGQPSELEQRYRALHEALERSTLAARAGMAGAFGQARALHRSSQRTLGLVTLACLVLLAGLSAWVVTQVSRPLLRLTTVARRIATEGDLTQRVDITSGDEIGQLADSLRALVERLRQVPLGLADEMVQLEQAVASMVRVAQFQAAFLAKQSESLAQATATVKSIEVTASAAAGKAQTVQQVVSQVEAAGAMGQQALDASVQSLEELRAQVGTIVRTITELAERNVQVGSIAATVRDLASQSNVLALNATLEAARAGEHGRGFSVVASEIRTLAGESVKSTQRIGHMLRDIQGSIRNAVSTTEASSREMAGGINQVLLLGEGLREMTGVLQESGHAAREIVSAVQQQSEGVARLSEVMTSVVGAVGELQSSTRAAEEEVERVQCILERVQRMVAGFRVSRAAGP